MPSIGGFLGESYRVIDGAVVAGSRAYRGSANRNFPERGPALHLNICSLYLRCWRVVRNGPVKIAGGFGVMMFCSATDGPRAIQGKRAGPFYDLYRSGRQVHFQQKHWWL